MENYIYNVFKVLILLGKKKGSENGSVDYGA